MGIDKELMIRVAAIVGTIGAAFVISRRIFIYKRTRPGTGSGGITPVLFIFYILLIYCIIALVFLVCPLFINNTGLIFGLLSLVIVVLDTIVKIQQYKLDKSK
jgi:hypothetical protein